MRLKIWARQEERKLCVNLGESKCERGLPAYGRSQAELSWKTERVGMGSVAHVVAFANLGTLGNSDIAESWPFLCCFSIKYTWGASNGMKVEKECKASLQIAFNVLLRNLNSFM